ncbi:ATP-binding cassette domain-containing protein [Notoacmeibacter sp. MSK16QG-6]|uniref:ABC transporter ATP-binding protein n=1 Tax=Notoacmeibacter sp. MSK16QG-6 TaxID=2957982 RepID=UPI00209D55CD|nr:ABC transporter ATP-binding protein/permease [Notoacmeibacter sp. MSK16QG-6]
MKQAGQSPDLPTQADDLRTDYNRRETVSDHVFGLTEDVIDPFERDDDDLLPGDAMAFILHFARQAKGPFAAMLIVGGLSGAVDAALYWSVGWLVDLMEREGPADFLAENWLPLVGLLVLILIVRAAVMIGQTMLEQQVISPRFIAMIRWQAFRRVIEQPLSFYQNDFAGRIAQKIIQAGESTTDLITSVIGTFWSFATFVVLTGSILVAMDPILGVVVAVWVVCYLAVARFLLPRVRKTSRRRANARSILSGRLVDAFTNILAVKLFDDGRREHAFVREGVEHLLYATAHAARAITTVRASVAILNGFMMAAVGIVAVRGWLAGDVTTGAIAAAMGLVFRLNQMSGWVMFNINGIVRNFATVQDATATISVRPALQDAPDAVDIDRAEGAIAFENVSFSYGREDMPVISGLSFRIEPGERVAIVGPSGGGKTTILSLLLRLFDVDSGRITLDGRDIRHLTQSSLRRQFGMVSQEPMLMHRSIRDNIAYGRPEASDANIRDAARRAAADGFIQTVCDHRGRKGYDAHVGERGVKLSGGQRQRIAVARMVLKDAPILVLDEATSALDSEIEAAIQDSLETLMEGRTVIAVAHRLSTIARLDRIIVVDDGRIVEQGSHDDLLAQEGLYARLWKRQTGGFLPRNLAAE